MERFTVSHRDQLLPLSVAVKKKMSAKFHRFYLSRLCQRWEIERVRCTSGTGIISAGAYAFTVKGLHLCSHCAREMVNHE